MGRSALVNSTDGNQNHNNATAAMHCLQILHSYAGIFIEIDCDNERTHTYVCILAYACANICVCVCVCVCVCNNPGECISH